MQMNIEENISIYHEYRMKGIIIPYALYTNPKYKKLTANDKSAYAFLKARTELSRKNGWYDKDTGHIYFIFTNVELAKAMNVHPNTVTNVRKRLVDANLIEIVEMGNNLPCKLYLKNPICTEEDIYKIVEHENYKYEPYDAKKAAAEKTKNQQGNEQEKEEKPKMKYRLTKIVIPGGARVEDDRLTKIVSRETQKLCANELNNVFNNEIKEEITKPQSEEKNRITGMYPDIPFQIQEILLKNLDPERAAQVWLKMLGAYKKSNLIKSADGKKMQMLLKADQEFMDQIALILNIAFAKDRAGAITDTLDGYIFTTVKNTCNELAALLTGAAMLPKKPQQQPRRGYARNEVVPEFMKEPNKAAAAEEAARADAEFERQVAELQAKLKGKYKGKEPAAEQI